MGITNLFASVNTVGGQSLVIGIDGEVRLLKDGEQPLEGELVINLNQAEGDKVQQADIQQILPDGQPIDITQDIDAIISAIEQGVDPTLADPELAPAAGGAEGSSIGISGTIGRDGTESQPQTLFVTQAGSELDLSRTQSLSLIDLFSLGVSNALPDAVDDPIAFNLTLGNMSKWLSFPSEGWDGATITSSFDGQSANWEAVSHDRIGVTDSTASGGPSSQIQYDRESQQSEKLSIQFEQAATQGRFAVTNVMSNEGAVSDPSQSNNEVGVWIAYLNGVVAASGSFEGQTDGGSKFFVDIDTNGNAFDQIVFMANEYSLGLQGDTGLDSSDYYVAGVEVSSPGYYATNPGEELRIPIAEILSNDSDPDGGSLVITQLIDTLTNGTARIDGNDIVFTPNSDTGVTQLEYEIRDEDGDTDRAFINIIVNEPPAPAVVTEIGLLDDTVYEGESLIYSVSFDKPTLTDTKFNFSLIPLLTASSDDINEAQISFTNGVYIDTDGKLVVPEGVAKFDFVLPTIVDNANDDGDQIALRIENLDLNGQVIDTVESIGTILDHPIDPINIAYELTQGDITLNGGSNHQWNDVALAASFAGSNSTQVSTNDVTGRVGITGGADRAGPEGQIQYDRDSGTSEKLSVKLTTPATTGSFLISRLFENEGEGENNHESGSWIAKLNGEAVASGQFDGEGLGRGNRETFDIDTNGLAFDEIVFSANEYSAGLQGDTEKDSSDYFLEGIQVSATNTFAVIETTDVNDPTYLELSEALIFSQLDHSNGQSYQLTASTLTNPDAGTVSFDNGKIKFEAAVGFTGDSTIEYEVTDDNSNILVGVIHLSVKETPELATVENLIANEIALSEGEELSFLIELDKVTLTETPLNFSLASTDGDVLDSIKLDELTFTNGVTYTFNNDGTGQFFVPESVGEFEVYLPTNSAVDGNRGISLTVAAHETITYLSDDIDILSETDTASDEAELIVGGLGNDNINASGGDDILIGGLGNDILTGGEGDDIFKWLDQPQSRNDQDTVTDFQLSGDKIDVSDILSDDMDLNTLLAEIEITKQDDSSVVVAVPLENNESVAITLSNDNIDQFDGYSSGQITGPAFNDLVSDIFINLPD
ncbi:cadherin-like domain-containing protein [Vibrio kasasachensis]|uniref:Ig-like domain-containing protein n=1 Tax=Vibrio kasasachensis TaxID=2910248 RepID=UPI003D0B95CE